MDPITIAVLGALAVLGNASLNEAAKKATADAYDALKQKIKARFGIGHKVPALIEALEAVPVNDPDTKTLQEQIAAFGVSLDPEILDAAKRLSAVVSVHGNIGSRRSTTVNATTAIGYFGDKGTATFNLNVPNVGDKPVR